MGKRSRLVADGLDDVLPPWAEDEWEGRVTPYSESELDDLVEGTISSIADSEAWLKLVTEHGEAEARRRVRAALILRDENARRAPRH